MAPPVFPRVVGSSPTGPTKDLARITLAVIVERVGEHDEDLTQGLKALESARRVRSKPVHGGLRYTPDEPTRRASLRRDEMPTPPEVERGCATTTQFDLNNMGDEHRLHDEKSPYSVKSRFRRLAGGVFPRFRYGPRRSRTFAAVGIMLLWWSRS